MGACFYDSELSTCPWRVKSSVMVIPWGAWSLFDSIAATPREQFNLKRSGQGWEEDHLYLPSHNQSHIDFELVSEFALRTSRQLLSGLEVSGGFSLIPYDI